MNVDIAICYQVNGNYCGMLISAIKAIVHSSLQCMEASQWIANTMDSTYRKMNILQWRNDFNDEFCFKVSFLLASHIGVRTDLAFGDSHGSFTTGLLVDWFNWYYDCDEQCKPAIHSNQYFHNNIGSKFIFLYHFLSAQEVKWPIHVEPIFLWIHLI